jgi:iron complex transport system ATP-binding protein
MDEPTTGLDFGQQIRLAATLRGLAQEGFAVLSTTHDPLRARTSFDRVIMLHHGHILADGPAATTLTDQAVRLLYGLGADQPIPSESDDGRWNQAANVSLR